MRRRAAGVLAAAPSVMTLAGATSAGAQKLGQAVETDVSWIRVVAALILCLILAGAAAVILRARLRGGVGGLGAMKLKLFDTGPRRLELIEQVRINPQLDVCLLRCDDKEYLIAATAQGAVVLAGDTPPRKQAKVP